nr:T cell receptor delta 3 {V-D-J junction} [mice, intestinal intraepithelial lymphocytes, Peptide Partial, 18 aa] [Mus sp.]
ILRVGEPPPEGYERTDKL